MVMLAALTAFACVSCSKSQQEPVEIIDDNYRNVYEIFVASFYDSDGDGCGDFNGITEKLDYIADMGYTGIWLMPIHRSPSYHKYDVIDYYSVDVRYGTMGDFENMVQEAHKRHINIIIDLVVNHTSNLNPWFLEAMKSHQQHTGSRYDYWYNFSDYPQFGYADGGQGVYYEARFTESMPDLNLSNPEVRAEISNIMKFWLDKGVDGFRLDATTSYYTDDIEGNVEFLSWLNSEAKRMKSDCYIVGEAWTSDTIISKFYQSGVDSFFHFSMAQGEGTLAQTVKVAKPATSYKAALGTINRIAGEHIPAVFLDNHDTDRITGAIGRSKLNRLKFVYGLAGMTNGTLYTYYGTEIGMVGSRKDENKRIAMLWDSDDTSNLCRNPEGTTQAEYVYPGVKQQLKDKESLLNYHKTINYWRNKYGAIARGEITFHNEYMTTHQLVFEKIWNDQNICIVINFNENESITIDLSELDYTSMEYICASEGKATFKNKVITLPAYTIAILTRGE